MVANSKPLCPGEVHLWWSALNVSEPVGAARESARSGRGYAMVAGGSFTGRGLCGRGGGAGAGRARFSAAVANKPRFSMIPTEAEMEFVKVADTAELPLGNMKIVVVSGKQVLLANVDGSYYAIANTCTHLGASLGKGVLNGSIVTCPRHGARFDVKTGKAVGEAKIAFVPMQVGDEQTYPVKVEGTDILVRVPSALHIFKQ